MIRLKAERLFKNTDPVVVQLMRRMFNANLIHIATKPGVVAISEEEQQKWWEGIDHTKKKVFAYRVEGRPWAIAAFSVLTDHGDFYTPLFFTDPTLRGGVGKQIIAHYISQCEKQIHGEQLMSNAAIRHLNKLAGWLVIGTDYDRFPDGRGVEILWHPGGGVDHEIKYPDYDAMLDYWLSDEEIWNKVI